MDGRNATHSYTGCVEDQQFLVLAFGPKTVDALKALVPNVRILQKASPRVAIIYGQPADIQRLKAQQGVEVTQAQTAAADLGRLELGERMFVDAWRVGHDKDDSDRVGEGKRWSAPDFEPPDPPTHRAR